MKKNISLIAVMFTILAIFAGCAKPALKCLSPEDSSVHHYLRGMELLEKGDIKGAEVKFNRATYCDARFSEAYSGLALVSMKKALDNDRQYRKIDVNKARDLLSAAWKYADTREAGFVYHLASIRVETAVNGKDSINRNQASFARAMTLKPDENKLVYYKGREAAPYFMGLAYMKARRFQQARKMFARVLKMKAEGKWNGMADKQWKRTDKIVRALGGITLGNVGQDIAVMESVTRGDISALLADELKIDKLFSGRIPVKSATDKLKRGFIPADILNYKFKNEALSMIKWGIRGLQPIYDSTTRANLFKPDQVMTRKEFALVLEDLLIKLTGNNKLATAYFGERNSPFPDVASAAPWYNAVMSVTTRNLMESQLSGEFRPNQPVDGAEAILAVRVLRHRINTY